jgi:acyl-coenzyme A synthetase/AMP-(fatty) acid ligase
MNITDPIRRNAYLAPDAPAIIRSDDTTLSYREFDALIDAVATRAMALGVRPGNTVARMFAGEFESLMLYLAMARIGAAVAPHFAPAKLLDLCLVGPGAGGHPTISNISVDESWWRPGPRTAPVPMHRDGSAPLALFGSSGTTGTPKFVAINHDNLQRRILVRGFVSRLPDQARQICMINIGTNIGFGSCLRVLWKCGALVFPSQSEPFVPAIERHRVNFVVMAPATLQAIADSVPSRSVALGSLRIIETAGSAVSDSLYDIVQQRLCRNVISLYGSVEAGGIAAAPKAVLRGLRGAAGFVLPNLEMQAVDENDAPVPAGAEGILRVRGNTCLDAYIGDADSAAVFRAGWIYPGDTGSVDSNGLVRLSGRASDVINHGGNKISPQVIEDVLLAAAGIRDAAAFGLPDAAGINQVAAAIVTHGNVRADVHELERVCREALGAWTPTVFMQMQDLPRNENGKVVREELKRMALASIAQQASR